jgi:transcription elongation GreA/GreB family factor
MTKIAIGYFRALNSALAYRHARKLELTQRFADAAMLGDDRENSPLDDAKLMMEVNEGKIATLTHLLSTLEAIDDVAEKKIYLGSRLDLTLQDDRALSVVLIDEGISLEAEYLPAGVRHLSCKTEMGAALLAKGAHPNLKRVEILSFE